MKLYLVLIIFLILRILSYCPTSQLPTTDSNVWLLSAFTVRTHFESIYQTNLKRDQANLLTGIVLGGSSLNRQFKDKLANVGLTHVVAASGMNVTLVSGFILGLIKVFRPKRIYKISIAMIFILFYSTITGFDPPIVRATLMFAAVLLATLTGRQHSSIFALLISAYIMLWVEPSLTSSPSFLLSFTAMLGQIIASNIRFQLPTVISLTVDNFVQTIMTLVVTLPIVLIYFSKFSLISTVSNMLVLWTVEPLMILGAIAGIFPPALIPASALLEYFLKIVNIFNREEFLIQTGPVNIIFATGYYLVFLSVIIFFNDHFRKLKITNS